MRILAIESSCDDSAAACMEDGRLVSSVALHQHADHAPWAGVVPEVASRRHLVQVPRAVEQALTEAGWSMTDVQAIAVTHRPGLLGSLLVGLAYAKGLALAQGIPLLGVDHIEAHLFSTDLEHPGLSFPRLGWVISGGHSHLYLVHGPGELQLIAKTRDDAAGEAYDKLAKRLGLGYPGGPVVDKLAVTGNPRRWPFAVPRMSDGSQDLSFSGLKTEAARAAAPLLPGEPVIDPSHPPDWVRDLCASFQHAVVAQFVQRTRHALEQCPAVRALTLAGGVACNRALRAALETQAREHGIAFAVPAPAYCTDNAAMVASLAAPRLAMGQRDALDLDASASHTLAGYVKARRHR